MEKFGTGIRYNTGWLEFELVVNSPQGEAVKEEPPDVADEEERDLQTPQPDEEEFRSLGLSLHYGPITMKTPNPKCRLFLKIDL
jgi:hypothetical protein